MKKIVLSFLFSIIFLNACKEDEDRIISTDLPAEATQLFDVSTAWSEALFFSMISFEQYSEGNSLDLPGCPTILIEETEKRVILSFDPAKSCQNSGKYMRTGKLIIDFGRADSINPLWYLEYENYTFEAASVNGIRIFTKNSLGLVNETFEDLTHITSSSRLTHKFSGKLTHTLILDAPMVASLNSKGVISGRNPAGRNFKFDFEEKRQLLFSCFQKNELLPVSGKETWQVSRMEVGKVIHRLSYELKENCKVEAYVVLSDARRLLLNP